VKKEQLLDMIGEAPDAYVKDAKENKKRRTPKAIKWLGGIAAALAIIILVNNMPGIPLLVTAKTVSAASDSRKLPRPKGGIDSAEYEEWRAQLSARQTGVESARLPIAEFSELISEEVLSGTDGENRVWSPINAYIALAMTAELTGGETRADVLGVLGINSIEVLRKNISAVWEEIYENNGKEISVLANSLWLDKDVKYVKETMDAISHHYYASVFKGDLGSERTNKDIANWMRNQTGGMLKDRTGNVDLPPDAQVLTMASTVYFQSKWSDEFNKSANTQGIFHGSEGDVECTFMNKEKYHMNYYWADDYGAVQLTTENGSSMWFILPDEGKTVNDVLASGDYMAMMTVPSAWDDTAKNRKWMKVNLSVPKFDVYASTDLKGALQKAGLEDLFEPYGNNFPEGNDFTPSVIQVNEANDPVYLHSINQDTRVTIDEQGVTAASYIELNFGAGAAAPPDEIIDFTVDRPFVFAITKSGIPMFVGTVNMP